MTGLGSETGRGADSPQGRDDRQLIWVGRTGAGGGPGSWSPGGWGPGGFGGPGGHGGRGQRDERRTGEHAPVTAPDGALETLRGKRIDRGGRRDVMAAILLLLDEWPMRESQVTRELAERSGSAWIVDTASVESALEILADADMVGTSDVEGHDVARLTPRGAEYVEQHRGDLGSPWDDVESTVAVATRGATLTSGRGSGPPDALEAYEPREREPEDT